ncbi:MAG TPA: hypothetical protein VKD72_24160, partial [Gemmataceae bacterium]|nr:hypothetical protein [Gemmataceae bacterium]
FDRWLAWAEARRVSDPAAAEAALDELLRRDRGNSKAMNLRTQVGKQRFKGEITALIAENKIASSREAAHKLYGSDARKLEDAERDQLGEAIAKGWLELTKKEKNPRLRKELLIALTTDIPDSIPSSKAAKQLIGEIPDIEGDQVVRDAVKDLLKERFPEAKAALLKVRREVGTSDGDLVARVDALLPVVELARSASADPLKGDLQGLEKALDDSRLTPADRSNLKGLSGRLFDRRISLRVRALPRDVNWSQLLEDCGKAEEGPSVWVLACRVECRVELKKTHGKEWTTARSDLEKFRAEPEAAPYVAYVLALADWQANEYPAAANRLLRILEDDKPLPAVLQDAPARRTKAVQFLLAAVGVLRGRGQLTQPFGTARDAAEAFGWLRQARRLAGDTASVPLRANLALAAWYKPSRATDVAKDLTNTLKDRATLKEGLLDVDVYRILLIHAATRENTAAGRKDALEGYLAALDCVREFLNNKTEPQIAEHFYGEVVKPASAEDGKALLGDGPDDEVKGRYSRLCGGIARLFKDFGPSWYRVTKPAGGPIQQAKELYDLAYQNATSDAERAEFLAFKGFMSNELPSPKVNQLKEFAAQAQKLAPSYAGGFGLESSALILEERGKTDLADRQRLLTQADRKLDEALKRVEDLKPENRQRELKALLLRTKGVLHLELANYYSVADRDKREESLDTAQRAIEQALRLDERSLEARDTLGCIVEDYGWLLGKTEQFDKACKTFAKAMEPGSLEAGRTSPWLGRGRTRFKWAEALIGSKGPDDKTAKELLEESASDLGEVVDHPRHPIQVAEALYWQGRIHTLGNKTQDAQDAFKRAVKLARQEKSEGWEEAAVQGWADVAAREVLARYQDPSYDLATNLKEALKRCDELEKFSKSRAAAFRVGLIRLSISLDKEKSELEKREALLKVFENGLEPGRTQDEYFRVHLLVQRSDVYMKGREVKRDLARAHADASAALKLSEQTTVDAGTRAYALGIIGLARQAQAPSADEKTKEEYREEAVQSLRKALDLSPKHFAAWEWKGYLSGLLILKLPKKVMAGGPRRAEATLAEEACRYYLEAVQDIPEVERKGPDYTWLGDISQPNLKEKAVPILRAALERFPRDADAWKWHRGIAAVLAAEEKDEDLKQEARASLRKALEGARNANDRKRLKTLQEKIN